MMCAGVLDAYELRLDEVIIMDSVMCPKCRVKHDVVEMDGKYVYYCPGWQRVLYADTHEFRGEQKISDWCRWER